MKQKDLRLYHNIGFGVLTFLLIASSVFAIVTYSNRDIYNTSPLFMLAIQYHIIMIFLIVVSVAFGFFWSNISYGEILRQKKDSKSILEIVMLFLNNEEREIINFLVKNNGVTTQTEISRLPGFSRVKAYRALQKMREKRLIEVTPHGKVRKVLLKQNIYESILEN